MVCDDALLCVFEHMPDYEGVLRKVCRRWRALLKERKRIALSWPSVPLFDLAVSEWGMPTDLARVTGFKDPFLFDHTMARCGGTVEELLPYVFKADSVAAFARLWKCDTVSLMMAARADAVKCVQQIVMSGFFDTNDRRRVLHEAARGGALRTFMFLVAGEQLHNRDLFLDNDILVLFLMSGCSAATLNEVINVGFSVGGHFMMCLFKRRFNGEFKNAASFYFGLDKDKWWSDYVASACTNLDDNEAIDGLEFLHARGYSVRGAFHHMRFLGMDRPRVTEAILRMHPELHEYRSPEPVGWPDE